jgi:hypothetical protein
MGRSANFIVGFVVIGAMLCVQWWAILAQDAGLFVRDVVSFAAASKAYWAERVLAGELPLWAPHLGGGMPFLADPANQAFYPANALFLFPGVDVFDGLNYFILLHMVGACASVAMLCRRLGIGGAATVYVALTFVLSGYVLSIADNVTYLPAAVWAPALIAALVGDDRARVSLRELAVAAVCFALMIVAGDPINAAIALAVGGLMANVSHNAGGGADLGGRFVLLIAVGGIGGLLAAVQVFPAMELIELSARATGLEYETATELSLPPRRLIEYVQPYFYGAPRFENAFGELLYPARGTPWAKSIYLGLIPTFFAASAFIRQPRAMAVWAVVGCIAGVLALGHHTFVYQWVWEYIPGAGSFRYPEKFVFWVTLCVCVLAGFGLDGIRSRGFCATTGVRQIALPVLSGCVAFVVLLEAPIRYWLGEQRTSTSAYWSERLATEVSHAQGLSLHGAVVLCAVVGALALAHRFRHVWLVLAVLGTADLLFVHQGFPPTSKVNWTDELAHGRGHLAEPLGMATLPWEVGEVGRIGQRHQLGPRVYYDQMVSDEALREDVHAALRIDNTHGMGVRVWEYLSVTRTRRHKPNVGALSGLRYLNSRWTPLVLSSQIERMRALARSPHRTLAMASTGWVISPISPANPAWNQPGFTEVFSDTEENYRVLRVRQPYPRVYWQDGATSDVDASASASASARGIHWDTDAAESLQLHVESVWPRELVITESMYPGWEATLDSSAAKLYSFDGFLAMHIPRGQHDVELFYKPTLSLRLGALASSVGLVVVLVLMYVRRGGPSTAL